MDPSFCNVKVIDEIRILKEVHSKFNYAIDSILQLGLSFNDPERETSKMSVT